MRRSGCSSSAVALSALFACSTVPTSDSGGDHVAYSTVSFRFGSANHRRPEQTMVTLSASPEEAATALIAQLRAEGATILAYEKSSDVVVIPERAAECWDAARELADHDWTSYRANDYTAGAAFDREAPFTKRGVTSGCWWAKAEPRPNVDAWYLKAELDAERERGAPSRGLRSWLHARFWREPGQAKTTAYLQANPAAPRSDGTGYLESWGDNTITHDYWPLATGELEATIVDRELAWLRTKESSEWKDRGAPKTAPDVRAPARSIVVAVFDVEDASKLLEAAQIDQLSDYLIARMAELAGFRVVPRQQLRARLQEQKSEGFKACYDEACQIELGKALAAEKSIATKLIRLGDQCAISATLFDLKTETTEKASSVRTTCGVSALLDAVDQLARALANQGNK